MKKVISIALCVMMACSLFAVNVSANTIAEQGFTNHEHLVWEQTYDGTTNGFRPEAAVGSEKDYYDDKVEIVDDGSGSNNVLHVTITEGTAGTTHSIDGFSTNQAGPNDIDLLNGIVVRYDIMKKDDGVAIGVEFADNDDGTRRIIIIPSTEIPETDKWYTVETSYVEGGTPQVIIYDRETGLGKAASTVSSMSNIIGATNTNKVRLTSDSRYEAFRNNMAPDHTHEDTDYYFDNVKVYNSSKLQSSGVILNKDYESQTRSIWQYSVTAAGVENMTVNYGMEAGNTYQVMERIGATNHSWVRYNLNGDITTMPTDNYQMTIDVCKMALGHSLSLQMCSTAGNWDGYVIPARDVEIGTWYTYKMVEKNGEFKAYRKLRGSEDPFTEIHVVGDSERVEDYKDGASVKHKGLQISSGWKNYAMVMIEQTQGGAGNDPTSTGADLTGIGSKWAYDNYKIEELNAFTNEHIDENRRKYNRFYFSTADLATTEFMPMIGYYDATGKMVDYDFVGNAAVKDGEGVSAQFLLFDDGTTYDVIKNNGGSARMFCLGADGKILTKDLVITANFD